MKPLNIFIVVLLIIFGACNSSPKGFVIRGSFPGLQDGMICSLRNIEEDKILAIDTVKNGGFELSGYAAHPAGSEIVFSNKPLIDTTKEESSEWFVTFLLDNSEMTLEVEHIDSLYCFYPDRNWKPLLLGGQLQTDYNDYLVQAHALEFLVDSLDGLLIWLSKDDYTPEAYDKRYMELQLAYDKAKARLDSCKMNFIREHPKSFLSLRFIVLRFYQGFDYTQEEVEELIRIGEGIPDSLEQIRFREMAEKAKKSYKGIKHADIELELPSGDVAKISELLPQSKYILLDFWASWCGPCRAAIPNVKALYEKYDRSQLNVLSVSLDANRADWEQAMKEENMPWKQAWAGEGEMRDDVYRNYNISNIPCLILIDSDGRVLLSTYKMDLIRLTLKQLLENEIN